MELVVTGPTFALPHGGLVMWDFEPKEPAGMTIRGVTEGEKEVTLDSRVVPHVTSTVVNALNQVNVAKRTPTDMMKLSTGLVFRTLFDNRTSVSEDELMKTRKTKVAVVGLLGGVVLTYCAYSPPAVMKLNSIRTQIRQALLKHKIDHVEVGNDDPRHIGSHDPFGVIPGTHFHLVLAAPGLTEGAQKAIESVLEEGLK
jgi:hypothetical protein